MIVYLHIGLSKTGTKAIQHSLYRARQELGQQGVLYPDLGVTHSLRMLHAFAEFEDLPPRSSLSRQENERFRNEIRHRLASTLENGSFEKVILSGEGMTRLVYDGVVRLREFLEQWTEDIFVIVYLRDPVAVASSFTQFWVQQGAVFPASPAEAVVPEFRSSIEPFLKAFGGERVLFRPFPPDRADVSGIVQDFLSIVGCDHLRGLVPDIEYNVSWSDWAVRTLEAYNRRYPEWTRPGGDRRNPDRSLKPGARFWLSSMKGPPFRLERSFLEKVAELNRDDQRWVEEAAGFRLQPEATLQEPEPARLDPAVYDELALRIHELVLARAEGDAKAERGAARAIIDAVPADCEIGERLRRSAHRE